MKKLKIFLYGLLAGVAVSALAAFVHADRIRILERQVHYGLVLALAISTLALIWLNRAFQSRLAGLGFLVAWVAVTLRLAVETSGGDLVFMVAWYSTTYIIAGAIILATAATMPVMRRPTGNQRIFATPDRDLDPASPGN